MVTNNQDYRSGQEIISSLVAPSHSTNIILLGGKKSISHFANVKIRFKSILPA